jgi:hypothetical protein
MLSIARTVWSFAYMGLPSDLIFFRCSVLLDQYIRSGKPVDADLGVVIIWSYSRLDLTHLLSELFTDSILNGNPSTNVLHDPANYMMALPSRGWMPSKLRPI